MSALAKIFPSSAKITSKAGDIAFDSLSGKTVFLYFSASWCPPCRGFTPLLSEFYEKYHKEKNFEVIFISWDEEEADHNSYYAKMPWAQLPFAYRNEMKTLMEKFNVESIPTLIGLNADTGAVISTKARGHLPNDPSGLSFPWPDQ